MNVDFAILGPGKIADRALAPAIKKTRGARLRSVLSRDQERGEVFARKHGATGDDPAPRTLAALLDDDELDAVIVASPDRLHAEQAVAAAEAGKHVFVEKPMATDREGAHRMVDACRAANVRLGVAYHLRWHAGHRELVRRIRAGELGSIRHVRAQWTWNAGDTSNWRASESVGRWWSLGGVGTHCLDLVRWILVPTHGEPIESRAIVTRDVHRGPHDETCVLSLRFANGSTAEIVSSVLFEAPPRLEVFGSKGWAVGDETLGTHGGGQIWLGHNKMPFEKVDPYAAEIADFVQAIREGRDPEVNGEEGLRNVDLLLRAIGDEG